MYYIIFNGIDSRSLDIHIETLPERVSPQQRYTTTEIAGRHGTLTETDGTYEPYTVSVECTVLNLDKIDAICAAYKGSGWLVSSDNLNRKYFARISNLFELSKPIKLWRRFLLQFEVQPFGYEVQSQIVELKNGGVLINYGTYESQPTIAIYGSGDVTLNVNGQGVICKEISGKIVIDSEAQSAYNDTTLLNQQMLGEFPVFSVGENVISWTGNVTKMEIDPKWRWL